MSNKQDKFYRWLAYRLPKRFAMWVYFDILAKATTGKYGNTVVPDLTAMDAIDRFCKDNNL